jgi:hypothetical protein
MQQEARSFFLLGVARFVSQAERIPSADTNIGHTLPVVKKGGDGRLPANPHNRYAASAANRLCGKSQGNRPPSSFATGASLRGGAPLMRALWASGLDYRKLMLWNQTISKLNAEIHTKGTFLDPNGC